MFDLSNRKSSYQIRQGLVHLWNLVALKALGLKKIVKKIEFEGVWGKLEAKNCFQRQSFTKYLR